MKINKIEECPKKINFSLDVIYEHSQALFILKTLHPLQASIQLKIINDM